MEKKVFDLKDLNEDFWKKVVFFRIEFGSAWSMMPDSFEIVTIDKKKFFMDLDVCGNWSNLNPMFSHKSVMENGRYRTKFQIEDEGWHSIKEEFDGGGYAYIRGDLYDDYKKAVKGKGKIYDSIVIVAGIMGVEHLEEYIEITTKKRRDAIIAAREERERNKYLPEDLLWKQMHVNNIKSNPVFGEYTLLINRQEEKLVAMKFTIVYQPYHVKPMLIDSQKGTERYVLFEKTYYDFYGSIDYPSCEETLNHFDSKLDMAFFDWACLSVGDMTSYGSFLCSFSTADEAKEYALCYANANSHIAGNQKTMVTHLDPKEDHRIRVERYEAYQAYRKYYKEIMEVVVNYDGYPDAGSGGGGFLIDEILRKVPQLTEKQLKFFIKDIPFVLEKRTQDYIEEEKQKSLLLSK